MFKIGSRTLKTAIGVVIAISIAKFFGLAGFVQAGILTILGIQPTKKKSVRQAWSRFLGAIISMVYSFIIFELIGYNPIAVGLILLVFIPTTLKLKITESIVTSAVVVLVFYGIGNMSIPSILDVLYIVIIGIGVALVMNLYIPSNEKRLVDVQRALEENFRKIFHEMSSYLRNGDHLWNGKEILDGADIIREAKGLALDNIENSFLRNEDQFYKYFRMREKQFGVIEQMLPLISSLKISMVHSKMIADLIDEISEGISSENTAVVFLAKLEDLQRAFKEMELPTTREEFEIRAILFNFLGELEQYLQIKASYKESDV